jgi:hypothetical protein
MPQLQKGTLTPIAKPVVVNVYFNGETLQSMIDDQTTKWIGSSHFTDAVKEYGVTPGSVAPAIALTEDAGTMLMSTDVENWLKGKLDGTHAEFGAVDATTLASEIFVLYYPAASTITFTNGGGKSCQDFGAYHLGVTLASGAVANYAVVPRCTPTAPQSQIQALTAAATGMIVSAATNPIPTATANTAGYAGFDQENLAWSLSNSEVGTACDVNKPVLLSDIGVMVSGTWSNAAAAAYHEPCIPTPDAQPYFAAAAVQTDLVPLLGTMAKGVKVPKGGSSKIALELFSDAPTTGAWDVTALAAQPGYDLSIAPTSGSNGDVLELTITDKGATGPSQFMIVSGLGTRHTFWYGYTTVN